MMYKINAIILSAGQSIRMGSHKALLKWNNQNTFLQKIVNEYIGAGIYDITLVLNNLNEKVILNTLATNAANIQVIINAKFESDRMESIRLAIKNAKKCRGVFIQDVDCPFITSDLLTKMVSKLQEGCFVSPSYKNQIGHPTLLSNKIIENLSNENNKEITLRDVLGCFKSIQVESNDPKLLVTINNPNEYKKYCNYSGGFCY